MVWSFLILPRAVLPRDMTFLLRTLVLSLCVAIPFGGVVRIIEVPDDDIPRLEVVGIGRQFDGFSPGLPVVRRAVTWTVLYVSGLLAPSRSCRGCHAPWSFCRRRAR